MSDEQKKFWHEKHLEGSLAHLSGVPGDVVIRCLGVESYITRKSHILEIGVGIGICLRYVKERCEAVYALDITEIALDRVRDIATGCWLEEEMPNLPEQTFDLVYSFNVSYHLTLESLSRQLRLVRPALKVGGVYAMHFSYTVDGSPSPPELPGALQAGAMTRSFEFLRQLGVYHRYSIAKEIDLGPMPGSNVGGAVIHLQRV